MTGPRRHRARRRAVLLLVVVVLVLVASLLAGVVYAAHRDRTYRRDVDASFSAEAGFLMVSSNATGRELASTMEHPGELGRVLLASRLQSLVQASAGQADAAVALESPPPDASAANAVIDTLRLRARATSTIAATLEGLLGLTFAQPLGSALRPPRAARPVGVPGARALLRQAGRELVLADATYRKLPGALLAASGGAALPASQWTSSTTGVLTPATLLAAAPLIARDSRLDATIHLVITAIETDPLELPVGAGYPITPTDTFTAAVSVRNVGSASTDVTATITVRPDGRLGHYDAGRATGVVGPQSAVALQFPAMRVVPGEHCLVTIELVRPSRQVDRDGLRWVRTVVVAAASS